MNRGKDRTAFQESSYVLAVIGGTISQVVLMVRGRLGGDQDGFDHRGEFDVRQADFHDAGAETFEQLQRFLDGRRNLLVDTAETERRIDPDPEALHVVLQGPGKGGTFSFALVGSFGS